MPAPESEAEGFRSHVPCGSCASKLCRMDASTFADIVDNDLEFHLQEHLQEALDHTKMIFKMKVRRRTACMKPPPKMSYEHCPGSGPFLHLLLKLHLEEVGWGLYGSSCSDQLKEMCSQPFNLKGLPSHPLPAQANASGWMVAFCLWASSLCVTQPWICFTAYVHPDRSNIST